MAKNIQIQYFGKNPIESEPAKVQRDVCLTFNVDFGVNIQTLNIWLVFVSLIEIFFEGYEFRYTIYDCIIRSIC